MNSENDLMQKLMISKKIMDRHNMMDKTGEKPKGNVNYNISTSVVEDYQPVNANYNIPQEFMAEQKQIPNPTTPTKDRILTSKLPDEIKKIMIDNPIPVVGMTNNVGITNELAEKASRLMGLEKKQNISEENSHQYIPPTQNSSNLRDIVKEVLTEILQENGLLIESTGKSNDNFSFRVGQHIFEGKVTKIKKLRKS